MIEQLANAIDVLVRRGMKNLDFCLYLARDGIVLMQEAGRDEIFPGALGYASIHVRKHNHLSAEDMDAAMRCGKHLVIPYDRVRKIQFCRRFSSCTMRREYVILLNYFDASRNERKMSAVLMPPACLGGEVSGNRAKETTMTEHAMEIKGILAEAFEPRGVFVSDL